MTAPILMAALCSFWGCDKDEDHLSEAVLASANTLNFEAERAAEKIITIYADADWVTEVPDWVTVTPNSGTGVMDVTVSVTDNMRDGAEDNPRKATLVFKGRTLASRAQVLITQNGDKYRDVKEYTAGELAALADETVISVPSAIVVAVTTKGFVISDDKNTDNIFVSDATTVAVGDKISLLGTKSSDSQKLATVIDCDEVTVLSGGAVNYPEPEDISAKIDDYTSSKRGYVTVKGVFNGSTLTVSEDAKYSVSVVDAPSSLGLSALTGHIVTVTGYYAGLAEPVQRIMATDVEDNGLNEIVYFLENFEWLEPWSVASGVGQTVETDNLDAKATALTSITVDGVTAFDAVEKLGYKFIYDKNDNKRIYLQQNYLKFGKTGNHAGIILPPIDGVPEAKDNVTLSFDWCGMRQGSGKIDPVNLIVIFENGSDKVQIDIPELGWEDGHKLEWVRAEVSLKGITVNKDTKITITQTQWEVGTAGSSTISKYPNRSNSDNRNPVKRNQPLTRESTADFFQRRCKKTEVFAPFLRLPARSPEETLDRVLHQAADRHGPDAARHGRDHRGLGFDGREIDIAAQFARLRVAVHPHVDHHGARRHHLRRDELRPPDGHHQNLRPARHFGEVARTTVGHRHRSVRVQEQFRHGKPHDIAAADHHGALAGDLHACGPQHLENAFRGAGERAGLFLPQRRNVQGMEAVDILLFVDGGDHLVLVDMFRKGQLDQNAVHLVVEVQRRDDVQQFGLGDRLRLADRGVADAHLGRSLGLARHIAHAAGVLAHEDDNQMGHTAIVRGEGLHLVRHFKFQFR